MNKKTIIAGIILIILAGIVFFGWQKSRKHTNEYLSVDHSVILQGKRFDVRVADTPETRELGLSYFRSLPANQGMIFLFDRADRYAFWMKGMRFPLDVVWLKKSTGNKYRVIGYESNVRPETYPAVFTTPEPADAFLELNAGTLERMSNILGIDLVLTKNGI